MSPSHTAFSYPSWFWFSSSVAQAGASTVQPGLLTPRVSVDPARHVLSPQTAFISDDSGKSQGSPTCTSDQTYKFGTSCDLLRLHNC